MMKKIKMSVGLSHINQREYPEATQITITMKSGKKVSQVVKIYTGMPNNPMSQQQLYEKFVLCCQRFDYSTLFNRLLHCETLTDSKNLTALK